MKITQTQEDELKRLLPEQYAQLIASKDVNAILDALDNLYLDLLDDDQEPTEASRRCEKLRDEIHWDNYH